MDMALLQELIEKNEDFYNRITGYPPGSAECQTLFSSIPETKGYDDKFVYGTFEGQELVAAADVISNHPEEGCCEIGTLLVAPARRRQGLARTLVEHIIGDQLKRRPMSRVRVEIQTTVEDAFAFFEAMGFRPTGRVRPWNYSQVTCDCVELERRL